MFGKKFPVIATGRIFSRDYSVGLQYRENLPLNAQKLGKKVICFFQPLFLETPKGIAVRTHPLTAVFKSNPDKLEKIESYKLQGIKSIGDSVKLTKKQRN